MKITVLFNVLAILVTVAQAFGFTGEVNPGNEVIVAGVIGLINLVLYLWKTYGDKNSAFVRNI